MKRILAAILTVLAALALSACGGHKATVQSFEFRQQQGDTKSIIAAQPVPHFNYSQLRQNLIEIETAQANGVQTTSFFFNQGVGDPVQSCPSIGAPIPTTDQVTNPQQPLRDNSQPLNNGGGNLTVGQMDPTGIYSADSLGTYVMCVGGNGKPYADYWEGFVQTVFGPAHWDRTQHQVALDGPPSFKFSAGR